MSKSKGFNMEDMFNVTSQEGDEAMLEPKVEQFMGKLRRLQEGKRKLDDELKELRSVKESLRKEWEALQADAYKRGEALKEVEEADRKLQVQCEESEQECVRQLYRIKKSEELLEQYNCEIQEIKLKHRKQRMMFENQLQQVIEQHKDLHAVFSAERLTDEIKIAEDANSQLLSAEKAKLVQLRCLEKELTTQETDTAVAEEQ